MTSRNRTVIHFKKQLQIIYNAVQNKTFYCMKKLRHTQLHQKLLNLQTSVKGQGVSLFDKPKHCMLREDLVFKHTELFISGLFISG
jgi:hypothetical protein